MGDSLADHSSVPLTVQLALAMSENIYSNAGSANILLIRPCVLSFSELWYPDLDTRRLQAALEDRSVYIHAGLWIWSPCAPV